MPFQFTLTPNRLPSFSNALNELILIQAFASSNEPGFRDIAFKELYNNIIQCLQTILDPQILNLLSENLAIFIVKLESDKYEAIRKIADATQQLSSITQLHQITQADVSSYNSFQYQIQQAQDEISQYIKAIEITNSVIDLLKKQLSKELIANSPVELYFRRQDFIMLKNCITQSMIGLKDFFSQFHEATVPNIVEPLSPRDKRRNFHKKEPHKILKSAIRHHMQKSGTENRLTLLFSLSKERRESVLLKALSVTDGFNEGNIENNDDDNPVQVNTTEVPATIAPLSTTAGQFPLKPVRAAPKPPIPALPPVRQVLLAPPVPPLPPSSNSSTPSDLEILTQACQRNFVPQFIAEIYDERERNEFDETQDNGLSLKVRESLNL